MSMPPPFDTLFKRALAAEKDNGPYHLTSNDLALTERKFQSALEDLIKVEKIFEVFHRKVPERHSGAESKPEPLRDSLKRPRGRPSSKRPKRKLDSSA